MKEKIFEGGNPPVRRIVDNLNKDVNKSGPATTELRKSTIIQKAEKFFGIKLS